MVSSLTTEGAEATLKALSLGAMDFIPKQLSKVSLEIVKIEEELIAKVKSLARKKPNLVPTKSNSLKNLAKVEKKSLTYRGNNQIRDVVAIGVSTGGPPVVQRLLELLPQDFPASILIAQHMPPAFTGPFARRLNTYSSLEVKEAEDEEILKPGKVLVAPGGKHLKLQQRVTHLEVRVSEFPRDALYKPSVDVLFSSVARAVGKRGVGVVLTGMGKDGLKGAKELKQKEARLVAQDETSCVVYGMPRAIVEEGLADAVLSPEEMPAKIYEYLFNP